jgi:hypothetical protein
MLWFCPFYSREEISVQKGWGMWTEIWLCSHHLEICHPPAIPQSFEGTQRLGRETRVQAHRVKSAQHLQPNCFPERLCERSGPGTPSPALSTQWGHLARTVSLGWESGTNTFYIWTSRSRDAFIIQLRKLSCDWALPILLVMMFIFVPNFVWLS